MLAFSLLATFGWAVVVSLLWRLWGKAGAIIAAFLPAGLFGLFAWRLYRHEWTEERVAWVPSLNVELGLRFDGLTGTYALLICGIGTLIVLFAAPYEIPARATRAFDALLFVFMGSMLGLVLADDIVTLFVFWELTSVTSYLLIGFESEKSSASKAARQALLVTATGGIAMFVGLLLLSEVAGTRRISEFHLAADAIRASPRYPVILGLIAAGAFAKSAIVPFHFWLPNAMAAPTPVSAYLHSATMVKAGIYLLTRLRPALGDTEAWFYLLGTAGAVTLVVGAMRLVNEYELKRVLAETTVISLGGLTMLIGMPGVYAVRAFSVFLVVHALYKAALFMIAGAVSHATHTLDLRQLGGLRHVMPITALSAVLSGVAMMGMPPMLGFFGKELIYSAALGADRLSAVWTSAAVIGITAMFCGALLSVYRVFFGMPTSVAENAHDPPAPMLIGPLVLGVSSLVFGVFHAGIERLIVQPNVQIIESPAASSVKGYWPETISGPLLLSVLTVALGILAYAYRRVLRDLTQRIPLFLRPRVEHAYDASLRALVVIATTQTRLIQNGRLRNYTLVVLASSAVALGLPLLSPMSIRFDLADLTFADSVAAGMVVLGVGLGVFARGRFTAALGVALAGYGIGVLFALIGAPDVALAQFAAESLILVALVLAASHIQPWQGAKASLGARLAAALLACVVGVAVTVSLLRANSHVFDPRLSEYFVTRSWPDGRGRNIVNTILVDFRAFDTLGEITVLLTAALAIWPLARGRIRAARASQKEAS